MQVQGKAQDLQNTDVLSHGSACASDAPSIAPTRQSGVEDFVMVFDGPISKTLFLLGFGVEANGPSKGTVFDITFGVFVRM